MNNKKTLRENAPGEYFDETSFKTLYGGVFITWVTTNTIVDLLEVSDPKLLGFIIALIVAFIGYLMSEKRTLKRLLVTPFNGFLIYLTIVGGTSFFPPPEVSGDRAERIEAVASEQQIDRMESGRLELESAEPETVAPERHDTVRMAPGRVLSERAEAERPESVRTVPDRRSSFVRSWN